MGANGKKWLRTDSNTIEEDNLGKLKTVDELKEIRELDALSGHGMP